MIFSAELVCSFLNSTAHVVVVLIIERSERVVRAVRRMARAQLLFLLGQGGVKNNCGGEVSPLKQIVAVRLRTLDLRYPYPPSPP